MTAEEILERLLDDLEEVVDMVQAEPGAEPSPLLDMIGAHLDEAREQLNRERLYGDLARRAA